MHKGEFNEYGYGVGKLGPSIFLFGGHPSAVSVWILFTVQPQFHLSEYIFFRFIFIPMQFSELCHKLESLRTLNTIPQFYSIPSLTPPFSILPNTLPFSFNFILSIACSNFVLPLSKPLNKFCFLRRNNHIQSQYWLVNESRSTLIFIV